MAGMSYDKELTAIQTWVKSTAGLNSWKLKETPTMLPRPVIIWDNPSRVKARNISRYEYVMDVRQYGRLCVCSVDDAVRYQDMLITDLEERCGVITVAENGQVIGKLKNAQLEFDESQDLDGIFILSYEVTYSRIVPTPAPHATAVYNRIVAEY